MKNGDLSKMSLKELRALKEQIEAAISAREAQDRVDLKKKLAEVAEKSGFSVAELFGGRAKRGAAVIKYRHPTDPSLTWTGRGRRPLWLTKAGGNIEKFRID